MKLLTKTLLFYIGSSFLVFFLGGYIFFEVLKHTFYDQVDHDLLTEQSIIEEEIKTNHELPDYSIRFGHEIEVILYNHTVKKYFVLKDTTIADTITKKSQYFRYLQVDNNFGHKGYSIALLEQFSGRYVLFRSVINMILFMFLAIMLFSIVINYIFSKKLWRPFNDTIKEISHYNIHNKSLMNFTRTNVTEFDALNNVLSSMSLKIRKDYYNLKEFTEDASHEIQTPIAIVKSKLELLIQTEGLTSTQARLIFEIDQAITRLSKLNSGLLLLAKIENNQYSENQFIHLNSYIEKSLESMEDFINHKNLKVTRIYNQEPDLEMNPILAEVLINNLVGNSIRHNHKDGFIEIELNRSSLIITNSGEPFLDNPDLLFKRFKKSGKHMDSIGLGLAIVKKICALYNIDVTYNYIEITHQFILQFNR